MTYTTPQTPEGLPGHQLRRSRMFKMRLTDSEADKLKIWARENELSQADFARFMIFSRTAFAPPNGSKLEAINRQLVGIAANINQCQRRINEAHRSGALNSAQFGKMGEAITAGISAWAEPLAELREELGKLKQSK